MASLIATEVKASGRDDAMLSFDLLKSPHSVRSVAAAAVALTFPKVRLHESTKYTS